MSVARLARGLARCTLEKRVSRPLLIPIVKVQTIRSIGLCVRQTQARPCCPLSRFHPASSRLGAVRFIRGVDYQPSQLKRKRKHGFLKRLRTKGGRKIIKRRLLKARKYLSH